MVAPNLVGCSATPKVCTYFKAKNNWTLQHADSTTKINRTHYTAQALSITPTTVWTSTRWMLTSCAVRSAVIFGRTHYVQTGHLIIFCPLQHYVVLQHCTSILTWNEICCVELQQKIIDILAWQQNANASMNGPLLQCKCSEIWTGSHWL